MYFVYMLSLGVGNIHILKIDNKCHYGWQYLANITAIKAGEMCLEVNN